jgi:hypothetical protein
MKEFKTQEAQEIIDIKLEFHRTDLLYKKANFVCFSDGVFTYEKKFKDGSFWEIQVISEDTTFMKSEVINDLIENKNLFFLSCRFFSKNINSEALKHENKYEVFGSKTFRIVDYITQEEYNKRIGNL